ncbi:MAG: cell envelope integrity protein CreD [Bacteroidetes bacterium]|nr:cell envelope integrity protein CreD [Bacteroidota bacterium]
MYNESIITTFWDRNKILIKGLLVGFLILIMLIPSVFILNLVSERKSRQEEVVKEVSSKWAGSQTLTGPVLMVPYKEPGQDANGKQVIYKKLAYFLPDVLTINSSMQPEKRHRSLFDVMLYRSAMDVSGHFNPLPLGALKIPPENIIWEEASIAIGINDVRGLENEVQVDWNGVKQNMEPGITPNTALTEGLSLPVKVDALTPVNFSMHIDLRGSGQLYFTPVGKTTEAVLTAPWKDPAFDGQYLPTETPNVTDKGFTAKWKILPVSHAFPQQWKDKAVSLTDGAFGVKLIQPVDGYAKTERSVKYAILFIALTFTIFFFLEILRKKHIHPLQYLLVGFALTIFYSLLLSISEYTGFNPAYLIATTATISLIGLYVRSIFKETKTAIGFTSVLAALYGYIFILIQLQDYALLFGSIGLFVIIAIMMYYSGKIDWYGTKQLNKPKEQDSDGNYVNIVQ